MATRPISLSDQDTDTAARQELDRVLASATFRQVDRLKRFLRFIVAGGAAGARRSAEGIRHRRAGLRQERVVRPARRPDRPRPGPAPARAARPLLPRGRAPTTPSSSSCRRAATRRSSRSARRRQAGGVRSARRSPARTRSPSCRSPIIARRTISTTSARACGRKSIHRLAKLDALRVLRRQPARRVRRRAGDDYPTAGRDAAHRRRAQVGRSAARHDPPRGQRHGVVSLVGVDRRRRRRRLRGAGGGRRRRGPQARAAAARRRAAARQPPAGGEPRRAQSLPAGALSPEPADRRRAAQGARVLREGDRRGSRSSRSRTAGSPTRTACSRTTACGSRRWRGRARRRAPRRR